MGGIIHIRILLFTLRTLVSKPDSVFQSYLQTTVVFKDVRTQAGYQLMDEGFVGIIISCFNTDAEHVRGNPK